MSLQVHKLFPEVQKNVQGCRTSSAGGLFPSTLSRRKRLPLKDLKKGSVHDALAPTNFWLELRGSRCAFLFHLLGWVLRQNLWTISMIWTIQDSTISGVLRSTSCYHAANDPAVAPAA
mmetsp:Transcript_10241/g.17890  ORF Transcript_10241/g.17890 Transcript_10241/m.17890 type:complete len:118 (+) Transcript_10241:19-372(+)